MSGAGFLYRPLDTPKRLADGLWIVDGPEIRFYGIPFPTRMTVVRQAGGGLWLHSPIAWTPALAARLAALGPVAHLVAPNSFHYAGLPGWATRCPEASVWAAPGVAGRAVRHGVDFPPHAVLGGTPPADWAGEIDQLHLDGNRLMDEIAFFHHASRTLILTDLIQNFEPRRLGPVMRWLVLIAGTRHPDGKMPIDMRLAYAGRRDRLRAAVRRMIAWDPAQVVMAHGRIYATDGAAELRRAFRRLL
ncbi:DUF4336 domain-containing protein [Rhodovulum sp. YNF3179]|uniref:DUF4336 domain-containing protein n=1 Tax=Rhodovulum sp. YNF3179 TaxID=3425127 RepID=UPI003D335D27